jgi:hypothetical protein
MAGELALLIFEKRRMHVFLIVAVMAGTLAPELLKKQLPIEIPSEVQIVEILFVFVSCFWERRERLLREEVGTRARAAFHGRSV